MKQKGLRILVTLMLAWLTVVHIFLPVKAAETGIACGGINILKTDVLGTGLPGAGFQIAREASQEELTNSSVPKRLLKAGEETLTVVYDAFWDNRDMTGGKISEVITSSDGTAAIYGLPYGTYYLVESRAPEGYNRMAAPVRISINKYSHLTSMDDIRDDENMVIDNTLHIVTIRYTLPDTGNMATKQISAAAIGLLVSMGALHGLNRIRQRYMQ